MNEIREAGMPEPGMSEPGMRKPGDDALDERDALDRHALVMAIWLPLGFVAVTLFARGWSVVDPWLVAGGFAVVLAGFVGHVIINAVYQSLFTPRELGLGLVIYAVSLIAWLLALPFGSATASALFAPLGIGYITVLLVVVFYLITHFGVRRAFDAFDVIRDFRP